MSLTTIPPVQSPWKEVSRYVIQDGVTLVRILLNQDTQQREYQVVEPRLDAKEQETKQFLRDTLIRTMEARPREDPETALQASCDEILATYKMKLDARTRGRLMYHLRRDILGYGPIDVMMQDKQLEDISCDGPGIPIFVFHREHESMRSNVVFEDDYDLDAFVIRLAQMAGKHISLAEPLLDATLPEGSRLQTTLSREVTTRGSSFTIRRFREEPLTPLDLMAYNTIDARLAAYYWILMESGASLVYAGGTASGKTTGLNAICQFIPPESKIVSIEDTRELSLLHENWIAGVTRTGFIGAKNSGSDAGIGMYQLLAAALRQRPEYLLVGEVRGTEALTLFQAMATGHAVYSTMHADSVTSAVHRLENPPISVPRMMLQSLDAISIQSMFRRDGKTQRRVRQIVEISGIDPDTGEILTNTAFEWDPLTDTFEFLGKSHVLDHFMDLRALDEEGMEAEWDQRMQYLTKLQAKGVKGYRAFSEAIHQYYRDPAKALKRTHG
ncbi:MAG: type II/IV secretion system ATPase subunit [Thermoplasmatota archaeon]